MAKEEREEEEQNRGGRMPLYQLLHIGKSYVYDSVWPEGVYGVSLCMAINLLTRQGRRSEKWNRTVGEGRKGRRKKEGAQRVRARARAREEA